MEETSAGALSGAVSPAGSAKEESSTRSSSTQAAPTGGADSNATAEAARAAQSMPFGGKSSNGAPSLEPNPSLEPVTMQSMLKSGAHYGHQTPRWNPKMLPFIFGERNGIHIINLDHTLQAWQKAAKFISDITARGGEILFVGTKTQVREIVKAEAQRSDSFHITSRWLGGTLSNFETIKRSINRMKKLEDLLAKALDESSEVQLAKKERLSIQRELDKLENNLGGIRRMRKLPDCLFIIDVNKESIAVAEARKLHIPVVALIDTNCDPTQIEYPIPSNDDAAKTVSLFVSNAAELIIESKRSFQRRQEEMRANIATNEKVSSERRGAARKSSSASSNAPSSKAGKAEQEASEKSAGADEGAAAATGTDATVEGQ